MGRDRVGNRLERVEGLIVVDAVEAFFDRVVRLVLTPSVIMVTFGFTSLATGIVTLLRYDGTYVHLSGVWGCLSVLSGVLTFVAIRWPTKRLIALSGSLLVVVFLARSFAIVESLLSIEQPSRAVEGSFVIASMAWMMMAYMVFVIWRRIVIPWAVMMRPTTREEWVAARGRLD